MRPFDFPGLRLVVIAAVFSWCFPAATAAGIYDLTIGKATINVSGKPMTALAINGQVPGPALRFKEGEEVVINVTNTLDEDTSVHWHGIILPNAQDGVPGLTFDGIRPGQTFTYRFPVRQSGTYWYHSHSRLQEQAGVYGPLVIEPKGREPYRYQRDYVVMLSDWHDTRPETILANLKKRPDYYNFAQRTVGNFLDDAARMGFGAAVRDRLDWGEMRMMPTDIADVSGYTFLVNGRNPEQNWTALFKPGERVRLRFINGSAMTYFDVRIPGLKMTVVQADGNDVQPVTVDEFRIAVAETYDVIVRPTEDKAYSVFAESLDRAGYARATLAPRDGMRAEVPAARERPLLTMADMGMAHGDGMAGMDHAAMGQGAPAQAAGAPKEPAQPMAGMDHAAMGHGAAATPAAPGADPFYAAGSGLAPKPEAGTKVLSYADLKAMAPLYGERKPGREVEIRLTGNMERYMWSINGVKFSDSEPIRLQRGERVRFKFINETMMAHPMHLHGMWTILDNGGGKWNPAKHVVSVAPGATLYADVETDAPGRWAFHCHLLYHMASGMFREVVVEGGPKSASAR